MTTTDRQLSRVLGEFARTMLTDFPIQAILDHLVGRIVEILPITAAGVTLISPTGPPRYVAASDAGALRFEALQSHLDEGPCLVAYRTKSVVEIANLREDRLFPRFSPEAITAGLGAVFAFPLRHNKRALGALDLYRDVPGALSKEALESAQVLADVAAAYLVNAQARADLKDASDRAHDSALHDPLTGLPNRVLLLERLEHALKRARRSNAAVAVLFVDLDHFKEVNDVYGHAAGDEVLNVVARRMSALLRPGDTLARLSGDEFVVVCEDLDGPKAAERVARRLSAALSTPVDLFGCLHTLSASVGVAMTLPGERDPETLIREADTAMYQVKRSGGAGFQLLDSRARRLAEDHENLRQDLAGTTSRGEMSVVYQPVVRPGDGRIVGGEALLRWEHPLRGPIAPHTFIPLAEQSGVIVDLGTWVLEQACLQRRRWRVGSHADDFVLAVNVSTRQILSEEFVASVATVLAATGAPPRGVSLEITESVFIHDPERALVVLTDLKRLGVRLALDDFGTGYSSLGYLNRFPVDIVKLDQSFVADLGVGTTHMIVEKVIDLAHNLGIAVVAEGVETTDQSNELARLGSDYCQGYLFGRPMSAEEFGALLLPPTALPVIAASAVAVPAPAT